MVSTLTMSSYLLAIIVGKTSFRMVVSKTLRYIKDGATSVVEFLKMLKLDTAMEYTTVIGLNKQDSASNLIPIRTLSTFNKFMWTDIPSKNGLTTKNTPIDADLYLLLLLIH